MYELCMQRVTEKQLQTLNLTYWQVDFSSSEMNYLKTS